MSVIYTASIDERLVITVDKADRDARVAQARKLGKTVEDISRHDLSSMDVDELTGWDNLTGSRDVDTSPAAARAIKEAMEDAEEGF